MKDDDKTLIDALRGGGHDDVADALDRKVQAGEDGDETRPTQPVDPNEQFVAELKSRINDPWTSTGLFGE
ncbi:MAG: hypothetical protein ACR2ML_10010 [Solirubrobacteraceae bacterium]